MIGIPASEIAVDGAPYAHVVIDGALLDYASLEHDFPAPERFDKQIRSHGDLTYPDQQYCKLIAESESFRHLHEWVYSADFCRFFLDVFSREIDAHVDSGALVLDPRKIPIKPEPFEGRQMLGRQRAVKRKPFLFPRLDIGIGRLGYGKVNGGRGVHIDNLTRLVSILVYIDENPSMVGGEHRMYALKGYEPIVERTYRPKANRLVASLQSNVAFHDVNPVTFIVGVRKALYMAVSCSTAIWRSQDDQRLARLSNNRNIPTITRKIAGKLRRMLR